MKDFIHEKHPVSSDRGTRYINHGTTAQKQKMERGCVVTCSLAEQYFCSFCSHVFDLTVSLGMGELIEESADGISESLMRYLGPRPVYEEVFMARRTFGRFKFFPVNFVLCNWTIICVSSF
jgi:hypothetical protein